MDVYRRIEDVQPMKNTVLTIGSFDGLHRGHQEVIHEVVTTARALEKKSVVVTFDPHPKHVLMPQDSFEVLMHVEKKLELLDFIGVDTVLVIPFDYKFSQTSAENFLQDVLIKYFNPSHIIVGYDHRFGHNREGDSEFLSMHREKGRYEVEVVAGVGDQDVILSSTRIRNLIRDGHVRRASFELGWQFGFEVIVVRGAGRGHSLNFPTANFVPENEAQLLPKTGVYFARALIEDDIYYGMCNIGFRPTFGEKDFVMEIHMFDCHLDDLYGETMEVQFLERIRDERKFDSTDDLKEQLERDRRFCASRINLYKEEE